MKLQIPTPRWAVPLLGDVRYKGAKGGRGSGKSHFFAEMLVERMVVDEDLCVVCIREIQKSLKFSAKKLIEGKIRALGVSHLFDITLTEIRRIGGEGICIFQGMQDHTADSIKSLEGFGVAWCEEAQSLTGRSIELLLPTIRADGSEVWFSWNPSQPTDAVDRIMCGDQKDEDSVCIHVNFSDNPFCPETLKKEADKHYVRDPKTYGNVWLGEYRDYSEAQIFSDKWVVEKFTPNDDWNGPYHGLDFGFSRDPTAGVKCWTANNTLMIEYEAGKVGLDLDETADFLEEKISGFCKHTVRADCARPESISYLKKIRKKQDGSTARRIPSIKPCKKWSGSVEDGIEHIRSYDKIIIHPRCTAMIEEARMYSYKIDKQTGDVMPKIVDAYNHYWDAVRYALGPMIKGSGYNLDNL